MLQFIRSFSRDERGVSALEYAILAGIVVAAVIAAGVVLTGTSGTGGGGLQGLFNTLMNKVTTQIGS
jgi:pilus assembly protein Flp/PilA